MTGKIRKTALLLLLAAICISAAGLYGCSTKNDGNTVSGGKLKVSVSFDAMKEFVKAVGKDKVEISVMMPDGTEPHSFEPKARDISGLSDADIFVYNGMGMEPWAEKTIEASGNDELIAVKASKGVKPVKLTDKAETEEHGEYDPHCWLSIKCAEKEVTNIKKAFIKADPDNTDYYEKNASVYIGRLEKLYDEYDKKFASTERKDFVTGHAAFGYLCRDFGLEQSSVEDVYAEGEPTASQLADLVKYCRENHVDVIFAEKLASPEVSETLADEVGARVETIYTMTGSENGKSYISRMRSDLQKIYASLAD